jgi:hypothetical protein
MVVVVVSTIVAMVSTMVAIIRMFTVSASPVSPTSRENTPGGGEQGDDAD